MFRGPASGPYGHDGTAHILNRFFELFLHQYLHHQDFALHPDLPMYHHPRRLVAGTLHVWSARPHQTTVRHLRRKRLGYIRCGRVTAGKLDVVRVGLSQMSFERNTIERCVEDVFKQPQRKFEIFTNIRNFRVKISNIRFRDTSTSSLYLMDNLRFQVICATESKPVWRNSRA